MLKTPKETKKGLECCSKSDGCPQECPYYDVPSCGGALKLGALNYIEQLEARVPKWISVKERLPKEIKRDDAEVSSSDLVIVAVCDDMDNIFVTDDIVCAGEWVNYPAPLFEVTHWMPLPELPKEG